MLPKFIASDEGKTFIAKLSAFLETGESSFETTLKYPQLKWLRQLQRVAGQELTTEDKLAPLTATLFTVMRGHVATGKMLDPHTPHKKACADGVYVGLLKAFTEIPKYGLSAAQVQDVSVINCARTAAR